MSKITLRILNLLALSLLIVGCNTLNNEKQPNTVTNTTKTELSTTKTMQNEAEVVRNASGQAKTVQQNVPYTHHLRNK